MDYQDTTSGRVSRSMGYEESGPKVITLEAGA